MNFTDRRCRLGLIAGSYNNIGSHRGQATGDTLANSAIATGNHGYFSMQVKQIHNTSPSVSTYCITNYP